MKKYYITADYNQRIYDIYIKNLGDEIIPIVLSDEAPVSERVWRVLSNKNNSVIIDFKVVCNAIAVVLYTRYLLNPQRTFIILSEKQERAFTWGYGAGTYGLEQEGKEEKKLARLKRDIKFYFEQVNEWQGEKTKEPVRDLLETYWRNGVFEDKDNNINKINFEKIENQQENYGEAIIERLRNYAIDNDKEEFKEELKNINCNQEISFNDYMLIGRLCKDMRMNAYRIAVLEQGIQRWGKRNTKLYFELVDAYIDSPNINQREKALEMVEEYFGIVYEKNGEIKIEGLEKEKKVEENYLKSLLNAYIGLEKFDELYKITVLKDFFASKMQCQDIENLFLRNKAIYMREKGKYKDALSLLTELYCKEATENTLQLIAVTTESMQEYEKTVKLQIALFLRKTGEWEYLLHIAEIMNNNCLIYNKTSWEKTKEISGKTDKQIIPLLLFAFSFEENQQESQILQDIYHFFDQINAINEKNFLLKYKDNVAYIWEDFCTSYRGKKKYDFLLVDYINAELEKEDFQIERYIEEIVKS